MNDKVGFSLVGIRTEQFATFDLKVNEEKEVQLSSGLGFNLDKENKQVGVFIKIEFIQNEKPFIIIETSNHYIIDSNSWDQFCSGGDDKMIIPRNFAIHLVGISMGTTRGVLHAKTENTSYNKFFLPTIGVEEMVKEDVELSLVEEDNT